MSKEAFYDAEIAPALLDLAKKCEDKGLSLVAMCEFEPNETGTTFSIRTEAGIEIMMSIMAMRARGNVDALLMALRQYGEEHGHQSLVLELLGLPPQPPSPGPDG